MWIDAKLASPPPALSQSLGRRHRGKSNYIVRDLPRSRTLRVLELVDFYSARQNTKDGSIARLALRVDAVCENGAI